MSPPVGVEPRRVVVGGGKLRYHGLRLQVVGQRRLGVAEAFPRRAPVAQHLGKVGPQTQRRVVVGDGLRVFPLGIVGQPAVVDRLHVIGAQFDGGGVVLHRVVVPSQTVADASLVEPGVRVVGIVTQGLVIIGHRSRSITQLVPRHASVQVGVGDVGAQGHHRVESCDGIRVPAQVVQHYPPVVVSLQQQRVKVDRRRIINQRALGIAKIITGVAPLVVRRRGQPVDFQRGAQRVNRLVGPSAPQASDSQVEPHREVVGTLRGQPLEHRVRHVIPADGETAVSENQAAGAPALLQAIVPPLPTGPAAPPLRPRLRRSGDRRGVEE